jgi:hypothetical protein
MQRIQWNPSNQRVWRGTYTINNSIWTLSTQEIYFYGIDGKRLGTFTVGPFSYATELFVYTRRGWWICLKTWRTNWHPCTVVLACTYENPDC